MVIGYELVQDYTCGHAPGGLETSCTYYVLYHTRYYPALQYTTTVLPVAVVFYLSPLTARTVPYERCDRSPLQ